MKKIGWLSLAAVLCSLALVGCKSDIEKYADEVCDCKDQKCVDEVAKKWGDKVGTKKEGGDKKLEDMSEKDKEAFGRALACSLKYVKTP